MSEVIAVRQGVPGDHDAPTDNDTYRPLQLTASSAETELIEMWLSGRPWETQRAYRKDLAIFRSFCAKELRLVTLRDLQLFAEALSDGESSSVYRRLASIKSLLSFAQDTGFLALNVGAALRLPKVPSTLARRIMDEESVARMLFAETDPRNQIIIRLLYGSGIRAAEIDGLQWKDCQPRGKAGQITVTGKGTKTRSILVSESTWSQLMTLGPGEADATVFLSKRGRPLTHSTLWRIVRAAAKNAGITLGVSPHWMRHAHASHALDRGAPIHLVQQTLGHASVATTGRYLHARPGESSSQFLPV